PVGDIAVAEELGPRDTDPGAAQSVGIQRAGVVDPTPGLGCARRGVSWVDAGEDVQDYCRISDRPRHRAGGVLAVRDRNDSRPADEAERWLDPYDPIRGRRTDDRSVGFRPDRGGAQIG